jgi:predicted transcriptional regulator
VNVAVLRRTITTSKQYDLEMDYFIVNALDKKNIGYRDLFRLVKEKYNRNISFDTLNRHIKHLVNSGMINKDQKYAPYYLTEKCKRQIKLLVLNLASPTTKKNESSVSTRLAFKRINVYILLLLFKSGSSYEFEKIKELEYFLSMFGLSMNSSVKSPRRGPLYKSKNEIYSMEVFESNDGRISVNKRRYLSSPHRTRNSTSFVCNIKGVKYPVTEYRLDPFRKTGITQEEIFDSLTLLSNEGILQKPTIYLGNNIYLFNDLHLYDLLFDLSAFCYGQARSILDKIWSLRRPVPEEKQWLQRIDGELAVTKSIERAREHRKKANLTYYKERELMTKMVQKTSIDVRETEEWLNKEYQDTLSDPRYDFIIQEMMRFVFPDWLRKIRTKVLQNQYVD